MHPDDESTTAPITELTEELQMLVGQGIGNMDQAIEMMGPAALVRGGSGRAGGGSGRAGGGSGRAGGGRGRAGGGSGRASGKAVSLLRHLESNTGIRLQNLPRNLS